ncbi:hypothetical protein BD780_002945 [Clostridium tetanomorphum]|uniref:Uncharacterized protein n=1 Tax=Clostridium tetanomorphum TaxID=1553 RepID=A0A923J008_CLOTT|nr:hypothetical protein [Clostridium tetanomorphum]KAJ53712.1 hypothetical protein CTM_00545 [Clostridium tetanomorphum DSM 665]MBC2397224.1 hypothetical protein [Clostridium tetanomorphum]MBP1862440.1 hypothetical protein [Clostridium tetanomorphum]NRS85720.1 hypothetical protein [Clostridium tetanomorphum]SQC02554.1 Uncharacterised protein [Clostridium tetanomorphum]
MLILCEQIEDQSGTTNRVISTQIFTRPASTGSTCESVTHDFIFVIPDTCRQTNRIFKATAVANYILDNTDCECPCS